MGERELLMSPSQPSFSLTEIFFETVQQAHDPRARAHHRRVFRWI